MVTLRKAEGVPEFSRVVGDPAKHYLELGPLALHFREVIRSFHETWYCIEPIECFVIMPDHIHLLIKIRNTEKLVSLPTLVWQLQRRMESTQPDAAGWSTTPAAGQSSAVACSAAQSSAVARSAAQSSAVARSAGQSSAVARSAGQHLFTRDWHDWIVSRDGQLKAFTRYIRENAMRRWLRMSHSEYFRRVNAIEFLGHTWYGYGNTGLLNLPVLEPFRCSRQWHESDQEWREAVARASRIGPGGAGIGTFMSACEKACGHAIGLAGGRWIVLSPEGFGERWHPARTYERFCAEGRMLFLSLYPAMAREPTKAELHQRCHEMGDIVAAGLNIGYK